MRHVHHHVGHDGVRGWTIGAALGSILISFGCPLGCLGWFGFICGFWGLILVPVGIVEIIAGIYGLTAPKKSATVLKISAGLEIVAMVAGGIISLIVGILSLVFLRDPEVLEFFES